MKTVFAFIAVASIAGFASGCAADESGETDDNNNVTVDVSDEIASKVKVEADRLVFDGDLLPKLEDQLKKVDAFAAAPAASRTRVEPVYFVNHRQADATDKDGWVREGVNNPLGYCRRALSWKMEKGKIVVMTEQATLPEADAEAARIPAFRLGLSGGGVKPQQGFGGGGANPFGKAGEDPDDNFEDRGGFFKGAAAADNSGGGGTPRKWEHKFGGDDGYKPLDISDKVLWEGKTAFGDTKHVIKLKRALINLRPVLSAEYLRKVGPNTGKAVIQTDLDAEVMFEATSQGAWEKDVGGDIIPPKTLAAPIGVPLSATFGVKWTCKVATSGQAVARWGASAKGSLRAGASFVGFTPSVIWDGGEGTKEKSGPKYEFKHTPPQADANIKALLECHVFSELTLQVFDAAGPKATIDIYGKAEADLQAQATAANGGSAGAKFSGKVTVGAEAKLSGALKPFGIKILEINAPPWKLEKEFPFGTQIGKLQ